MAWHETRIKCLKIEDSRFRFLLKEKEIYGPSSYLESVKIVKHRIALSKVRLGSHSFPIVTGIYDKTPKHERLCDLGCNKLGDECHYLFQCDHPFIKDLTVEFIQKTKEVKPQFNLIKNEERFDYLMNSNDPQTQCRFGKYVNDILKIYKELTI